MYHHCFEFLLDTSKCLINFCFIFNIPINQLIDISINISMDTDIWFLCALNMYESCFVSLP